MKDQRGVSLVEVILVVALVGFIGLMIVNLPNSMKAINKSQHQGVAKEIVSKQMEVVRQAGASQPNGQSSFYDSSLYQLPSSQGTVEISDCPAAICTQGETLKVAKVTVLWQEEGQSQNVSSTTLITSGGLGQ